MTWVRSYNPTKTSNVIFFDPGLSYTISWFVTYLCIQVVYEAGNQLALDWLLPCQQGEVVGQFVMGCNDGPLSVAVKLWPSCPAKDLEHIQYPYVHKRTFFNS